MTPEEFNVLHKATVTKRDWVQMAPRFHCADGFVISIQASGSHYSTPREFNGWPYWQFECGYPSTEEQMIMPFSEDPGNPTSTVYGDVPVEIVCEMINKHGGIKTEATK